MTYDGGKNGSGVYQSIINQIPPHKKYVEPFLGSGAVMRMKLAAGSNIGIDRDTRSVSLVVSILQDQRYQFIIGDGIHWLRDATLSKDDFVYCDPPYLMSVRSTKTRLYRYDIEEKDHVELLNVLKRLMCMVAISGYHNDIYNDMLSSWRTIEIPTVKRNGKRSIEVLWMNYPRPNQLHDYRYIGRNYRERERIKLKIKRWTNKLEHLPILERAAIIDSVLRSNTTDHTDTSGDGSDRK